MWHLYTEPCVICLYQVYDLFLEPSHPPEMCTGRLNTADSAGLTSDKLIRSTPKVRAKIWQDRKKICENYEHLFFDYTITDVWFFRLFFPWSYFHLVTEYPTWLHDALCLVNLLFIWLPLNRDLKIQPPSSSMNWWVIPAVQTEMLVDEREEEETVSIHRSNLQGTGALMK